MGTIDRESHDVKGNDGSARNPDTNFQSKARRGMRGGRRPAPLPEALPDEDVEAYRARVGPVLADRYADSVRKLFLKEKKLLASRGKKENGKADEAKPIRKTCSAEAPACSENYASVPNANDTSFAQFLESLGLLHERIQRLSNSVDELNRRNEKATAGTVLPAAELPPSVADTDSDAHSVEAMGIVADTAPSGAAIHAMSALNPTDIGDVLLCGFGVCGVRAKAFPLLESDAVLFQSGCDLPPNWYLREIFSAVRSLYPQETTEQIWDRYWDWMVAFFGLPLGGALRTPMAFYGYISSFVGRDSPSVSAPIAMANVVATWREMAR